MSTGAGESSWARSAKLKEFQRIKDSVRRLEQSSNAQLALEHESQNVFDFLKGETVRVKKSIGALSTVVDDELTTVRAEMGKLHDAIACGMSVAKEATDGTVSLIGETRKRDTEWMQLSFNQLKDAVAKLDADLKEARAQLIDLSGSYASAVASADSNQSTLSRQVTTLSERLATSEAHTNKVAAELDGGLRAQHHEMARWSRGAQDQLAAMTNFDSVQLMTEKVHAHTATLQQRQDSVTQQLAMAAEELTSHRDAIVLMVETVDTFSRQTKVAHDALAAQISDHVQASVQRDRLVEATLDSLASEVEATRDAASRLELRAQESHEVARLDDLNRSHQAAGMEKLTAEMFELKQQSAQHETLIRTMKMNTKDSVDGLGAFKASVRRALDEVDLRQDRLFRATSVFADALKVANPLAEDDLPATPTVY